MNALTVRDGLVYVLLAGGSVALAVLSTAGLSP
jgi:hypothetical protein